MLLLLLLGGGGGGGVGRGGEQGELTAAFPYDLDGPTGWEGGREGGREGEWVDGVREGLEVQQPPTNPRTCVCLGRGGWEGGRE